MGRDGDLLLAVVYTAAGQLAIALAPQDPQQEGGSSESTSEEFELESRVHTTGALAFRILAAAASCIHVHVHVAHPAVTDGPMARLWRRSLRGPTGFPFP